MKIVLAGGTGFVGKALCAELIAAGHEVIVLSRKPVSEIKNLKSAVWDGVNDGPWQSILEGTGAVINLAGESIAEGRWTAARKKTLRDSRILSTRALISGLASAKSRPHVLINASAVGFYGDREEQSCDENSPPGSGFLAQLCVDWEKEAAQARLYDVRVACARFGVVLACDGGALAKMLTPFKMFLGGPLGGGKQWMSWISRQDLIGLILHVLKSDLAGPINFTAPAPVTNKEFSAALGRALHRPSRIGVPAPVLKLALGEMAHMLLTGQRALPAKALQSHYSFLHPDIDSALKAATA